MPLALDEIEANVTAAWGLRQLLTSYTGPLAQAYADVGATTTDIDKAADGLLDRLQLTSWHSTHGVNGFGRWQKLYDQGPNGFDLSIATGTGPIWSSTLQATKTLLGDGVGSYMTGHVMSAAVGGRVDEVLLNDNVGAFFFVCQFSPTTVNNLANVFTDSEGWMGLEFNSPSGATATRPLHAWNWPGPEVETEKLDYNWGKTAICIWRKSATHLDVCLDGVWSAPIECGTNGGNGSTFQLGSAAFAGQIVVAVATNAYPSNEFCDAWGREESAIWGGHWPSAGGGGISRSRLVNAGAG